MALNFQAIAIGHIFPKLRFVSLSCEELYITLYFYVDGALSDDDEESINLMAGYFDSDFTEKEIEKVSIEIERRDFPDAITNCPGNCVYARKEMPPVGKTSRGVLTEKWIDRRDKILLALQRALINNIFPQIRSVHVRWKETSTTISFCIDGALSDDDKKSLKLIHAYFCLQFPHEEMEQCDIAIIRINLPKQITESYGTLAYLRKEAPEM